MNDQATSTGAGNALATKFLFKRPDDPTASSRLVKSLLLSSEAPGFLSGEIIAPTGPDDQHWTLIQRFREASEASAWKQSEARSRFLAEAQAAHGQELVVTEVDQVTESTTVTTAITTHVKPGMESVYRDWELQVQTAQASFPGFRGSYLQPGKEGAWISLLRFDSPESLDRWFNSPERKRLVEDAEKLVTSTEIQRVTSSFPGWVPVDPQTGKGPPNWKAFLLVLLGLYPIVMLELRFLNPLLKSFPSAPATLFANSISVAGTTWLTMPLFVKWFGPWLFPPKDSKPADNIKWVSIILCAFAAEVAVLWNLL